MSGDRVKYDWESDCAKLAGESDGDLVCIGWVYAHTDAGEGAVIFRPRVMSDVMECDVLQDALGDLESEYRRAVEKAFPLPGSKP